MTPPDDPSADAAFRSAWWLRGRHVQTIVPALFAPRARVPFTRETWDTPDGDFIEVDRAEPAVPTADRPVLVVFHGLESSADSRYVRGLAAAGLARGWSVIAPHFRGCGRLPNRRPRFYHSGDSDEIDWIVRRIAAGTATEAGARSIVVAGVSLGGNMLLKWLGEQGDAARAIVRAAAAVSAPIDLTAGGHQLGRGFNRFYAWMFLRTLKAKSRAKLAEHPRLFDGERMERARTLHEFDDVVTAPLHGFRDTDDYWLRASAKPFLRHITVPTLLLNARNDPFLPEDALATRDDVSDAVTLDFPQQGGHVGFFASGPDRSDWMPRRVVRFLAARTTSSAGSTSPPTSTPTSVPTAAPTSARPIASSPSQTA